jgi:Ca-activated chloride channel family protein
MAVNLQTQSAPTTFRINSEIVLVPVTVLDRKGGTVDNLRQENFTILEDQAPQRISSFFREDSPCSIGLVLDVSGSMRNNLGGAEDVARAFLETSNPRTSSSR